MATSNPAPAPGARETDPAELLAFADQLDLLAFGAPVDVAQLAELSSHLRALAARLRDAAPPTVKPGLNVDGVRDEDVERLRKKVDESRHMARYWRGGTMGVDAKAAAEWDAIGASWSRILAACERDRALIASPREAAGPETIRRAFLAGVLYVLGDEGITDDHEEMARVYADRTHATTPGIFVSEEVYQRLMARADTRGTEPSAARAMDAIIELIYSPDAPNHTDVRDCVRLDPELVAMYYERIVGIVSDYGMAGLEHDARSDAGESETATRDLCGACVGEGCDRCAGNGYEVAAAPRETALSEEECEVLRHLSYSVAEPDVYLPAFSQRDYTILHAALSRLSAPSATPTNNEAANNG